MGVTVSFLSEQILVGEGAKIDLTKAKTDYVLRQNHEAKQKAALRAFKKQQKAAEKRRANQHRQVYAASSDSGSVTTDTASISSFVPDVCASLVQDETKRTPERYFRAGRSYYLKRQGCVREGRELPTRFGKGTEPDQQPCARVGFDGYGKRRLAYSSEPVGAELSSLLLRKADDGIYFVERRSSTNSP